MRALVLRDIGDIGVDEVPSPAKRDGEVILSVRACGICGSDIPRAFKTGAHRMPLIIGHEFCGEADGKRYGVYPLIPCGCCEPCKKGWFEMCKSYDYLGSRRDGGFAEQVSVPEKNLIELPDEVSFSQAAMLEPMAVAVHAMKRAMASRHDGRIGSAVIIGAGTIGRLLSMFLSDAGVGDVQFCDSRVSGDEERVMSHFSGMGADAVFECVGREESYGLALRLAGSAGVVVLVGNPYGDMTAARDDYWRILRQQLTVIGTWNSSFRDDWEYALRRVADGAVHPEALITHRFELSDIVSGFYIMRDKSEKYCKIMCEL